MKQDISERKMLRTPSMLFERQIFAKNLHSPSHASSSIGTNDILMNMETFIGVHWFEEKNQNKSMHNTHTGTSFLF